MVIRISEEQRELSLSVGDLLACNPFHHEPTGFKFGKRLSIGQKLHQEYGEKKSEKNGQVTTEKFVKLSFNHKANGKQWSVKLAGKIDVYHDKSGKTEIDEVKTLTPAEFDEIVRRKEVSDMYQRFMTQVQLYLYMLEKAEGIKARGFLVLINIENGKIQKIAVNKDNMAGFIKENIDILLDEWQKRSQNLKKRAKNAKKVSFPFPTFRSIRNR
ncbi:MAG: PD-(D/E)XK nuclease family protein [Candidatus Odinarchaeota archaeon]